MHFFARKEETITAWLGWLILWLAIVFFSGVFLWLVYLLGLVVLWLAGIL